MGQPGRAVQSARLADRAVLSVLFGTSWPSARRAGWRAPGPIANSPRQEPGAVRLLGRGYDLQCAHHGAGRRRRRPFARPGVGKTHLLAGLGHALVDRGHKVLFMRTSELVQRLPSARRHLRLPAELAKLDRFDLLILDDLSYTRRDQAETSVLFELVAKRYERRASPSRPTHRSRRGTRCFPTRP